VSGTGGNTFAVTDTSLFLGGSIAAFGTAVPRSILAFGPSVPIAWSNLDGPPSTTVAVFSSSPPVYGRAEITAVTNQPGATPGLVAQLGFGPDGTDPAADPAWQWFDALYSAEAGSGDRFVASFTPTASGQYDYAFRYSYDNGGWVYADLDGSVNGYSPSQAGALTVMPTLDAHSTVRELAFALAGPNPVTGNARFGIDLPAARHVRLAVFDVSGRRVATLVDGVLPAGHHDVPWVAGGRSGIAQGVYHARLSVDDRAIDRRFVLLH
jgi:hypothetical protein